MLLANRKIKLKILYLLCVPEVKGYRELVGYMDSSDPGLKDQAEKKAGGRTLFCVTDLASLVVVCCSRVLQTAPTCGTLRAEVAAVVCAWRCVLPAVLQGLWYTSLRSLG